MQQYLLWVSMLFGPYVSLPVESYIILWPLAENVSEASSDKVVV